MTRIPKPEPTTRPPGPSGISPEAPPAQGTSLTSRVSDNEAAQILFEVGLAISGARVRAPNGGPIVTLSPDLARRIVQAAAAKLHAYAEEIYVSELVTP